MFAAERIRIIKAMLMDKKHINVSNLSTILNVSEVTIRRDLEKLENEKFLYRTHGGAILFDEEINDVQLPMDSDEYITERLEISEIASHLIEDDDTIIFSAGRTNHQIAKKISTRKNLTILTNDLNIAGEFNSNQSSRVILTGGDLDLKTNTLSGDLTLEFYRRFFVEKAFIEVDGVSFQRGCTVQSKENAAIAQVIMGLSKRTMLVCTSNTFDNIAFSQVCPMDGVKSVITGSKLPDKYKSYFFTNNIQLFTAYKAYEGEAK